ncbi:MAG: CopG family transcriptional regulator [Acidimicrobiia bacterium]|nr:CopG family transcriptional regulator [Acidimicrobiia bacterium]
MPFSLRLDPETEALLRRLTARTGRSKSQVVREAVAQYAAGTAEAEAPAQTAYDRLKPYIGTVSTSGANYSQNTHEKYGALLRNKHRARRTR